MNLLILAGLAKPPTREQIGREGMAALVLAAEQAMRCGVVFGPDFYAGCTDYEREALAQAADRLAADRAVLYGTAAQGIKQAAMLAAHQDGGKAVEAVNDATELAINEAKAASMTQQCLSESPFIKAPTKRIVIDEVSLPEGIAR